jgi:hypothetical protein
VNLQEIAQCMELFIEINEPAGNGTVHGIVYRNK